MWNKREINVKIQIIRRSGANRPRKKTTWRVICLLKFKAFWLRGPSENTKRHESALGISVPYLANQETANSCCIFAIRGFFECTLCILTYLALSHRQCNIIVKKRVFRFCCCFRPFLKSDVSKNRLHFCFLKND